MYQLYQEKLKDARFVDSTEGYNTDQEMGMAIKSLSKKEGISEELIKQILLFEYYKTK